MQRIESTKNFYINPDLSRAEAQLAFEQRQKRRTARKVIKRSDGSATGNNDTDDGSVDDAAVRSNLSATSAEFHLSSSSNLIWHHEWSTLVFCGHQLPGLIE